MSRTTTAIHAKNEFHRQARNRPARPVSLARRVIDLLLTWQERAEARRRLAEMPPYLLKDIGVSRSAALHEANKPFWKE